MLLFRIASKEITLREYNRFWYKPVPNNLKFTLKNHLAFFKKKKKKKRFPLIY